MNFINQIKHKLYNKIIKKTIKRNKCKSFKEKCEAQNHNFIEFYFENDYLKEIYLKQGNILPFLYKKNKIDKDNEEITLQNCLKDFKDVIYLYNNYNEINYNNKIEVNNQNIYDNDDKKINNIKELLLCLLEYRNGGVFVGTHWNLINMYKNQIDIIFLSLQNKYNYIYVLSKELYTDGGPWHLPYINFEHEYSIRQICHKKAYLC